MSWAFAAGIRGGTLPRMADLRVVLPIDAIMVSAEVALAAQLRRPVASDAFDQGIELTPLAASSPLFPQRRHLHQHRPPPA